LARLVDSRQLALTGRPQRMRAGFRHARDRGLRRTDAPMQLRAVTLFRMDSCLSRERRSPHRLRRFLYCSHTRCLQCGCRRTSSRHCARARLEPPRDRARVRFICAVGAFGRRVRTLSCALYVTASGSPALMPTNDSSGSHYSITVPSMLRREGLMLEGIRKTGPAGTSERDINEKGLSTERP
jgi:hypothetical protein